MKSGRLGRPFLLLPFTESGSKAIYWQEDNALSAYIMCAKHIISIAVYRLRLIQFERICVCLSMFDLWAEGKNEFLDAGTD
jgi:hypothetical protein